MKGLCKMTDDDLGCGVRETIWALKKKVKAAEDRADHAASTEVDMVTKYLRKQAADILGNAMAGRGKLDRCEAAAEALELAAEAIENKEHWQ